MQHPILAYALLAPLLGLFGRELWVLRAVTGAAGALSVGVLYLTVVATGQRRVAVLAALSLAGASFVVAYNRLGYTYNLLLLWSAVTLLAIVHWERDGPGGGRSARWLWGAVAGAALGFLTDQVGIVLPLFVALRVWPRRHLAAAALVAGLLPAVLAAGVALAWHPEASLTDWRHTLTRLSRRPPLGQAPDGAPCSPRHPPLQPPAWPAGC